MTSVAKQIFYTHLSIQTVFGTVLRSVDQTLLTPTLAIRGVSPKLMGDTETLGEQQDGLCGNRCHSVQLLEGAT